METFKHNLWQVLICLDQLLHCFLGLIFGYKIWADETFSSFQYRRYLDGKTNIKSCIDFIFKHILRDENHCQESYENERKDRHLPPEMRN